MSLPVWLPGLIFLLSGSLSGGGGSLSRGSLSRGICPGWGLCQGSLCKGGVHPGEEVVLSGRASVQGEAVSVKRGPLLDGDPHTEI